MKWRTLFDLSLDLASKRIAGNDRNSRFVENTSSFTIQTAGRHSSAGTGLANGSINRKYRSGIMHGEIEMIPPVSRQEKRAMDLIC
jgi:hypothetical protein